MLFADVAATSAAVAATSGRKAKIDLLAATLRGFSPAEAEPGAAFLAGELRRRQTGVGWASLTQVPPPAEQPTLTVTDVAEAVDRLAAVSGAGSQARRRQELHALFGAATAAEQLLLRGLFTGEVRQGALAGILADAVAKAAGIEPATVRRALLLSGDLAVVAAAALTGGAPALAEFSVQVGRPLAPMLAQAAATVEEALAVTGTPAMADVKLDGVRVQVHKSGDEVAIFSRSLDDITGRLPDIVTVVRALPQAELVLDGEAIAFDPAGRPMPFQVTASLAATRTGADSGLSAYFFDLLRVDGENLIDEPGHRRWHALAETVPAPMVIGRTPVGSAEAATDAFAQAVRAGHEGLVLKAVDAPYDVGRRGGAWVKVKPRHTLDLVVLAVEWGHGRRKGWLSNLHLGARDPRTGGFVMLGKTFKGLTDEMLRWQTERFQRLAVDKGDWVVTVRPEQVVEIAFDGVQTSPRYPGGVALRFARVLRYRDDKKAGEADTIDDVLRIKDGAGPNG
ncbi:ATP-dependent DNA ligase [Hamadaea tsunoensis]|uniref:ATP-dependent DNA ligase n=1 Tax=Hamadaea tsunoensis TaxID=53368 RepID=UPI0004252A8C|nr:ATP-dependent DNA ligase [Hamadaea tsunoensis]